MPSLPTIAILGSGNMGRALGIRLAHSSYPVLFGARRVEQSTAAATAAGPTARSVSLADAAASADVLIWTMRERDPAKVLGDGAPDLLAGKLIIDINNRDYAAEVIGENGAAWFTQSLAETLQAGLPQSARVVKAFNTVAMEALDIAPDALRGAGAQIFVAGADEDARKTAADIAAALGWAAVDLGGGPTALRAAEALGDVVRFAMIAGGLGGMANIRIDKLPAQMLGQIGERQESSYH